MPHGRLGISNELFSKAKKAKFKSKRVMASQPGQSAKEDRLERENKNLQQEIKRLRGIELVVQSLAEKGGVDFDGIMQSAPRDLWTSCSEGGFRRERDDVTQHQNEKGMGSRTGGSPSRTGGSPSRGNDNDDDDDDDDGDDGTYGKEREDNYGAGDLYGDDDYYGDDPYGNYGDEPYGNYYGDGGDDYS